MFGIHNTTDKKVRRHTRKMFYRSFFTNKKEDSKYEEKEVNGFYLIRFWDGTKEEWTVNLLSAESYRAYKDRSSTSLFS